MNRLSAWMGKTRISLATSITPFARVQVYFAARVEFSSLSIEGGSQIPAGSPVFGTIVYNKNMKAKKSAITRAVYRNAGTIEFDVAPGITFSASLDIFIDPESAEDGDGRNPRIDFESSESTLEGPLSEAGEVPFAFSLNILPDPADGLIRNNSLPSASVLLEIVDSADMAGLTSGGALDYSSGENACAELNSDTESAAAAPSQSSAVLLGPVLMALDRASLKQKLDSAALGETRRSAATNTGRRQVVSSKNPFVFTPPKS
ncbi:MAG: hypothetical protein AAGI72_04770 [Pseudomonadota bacterium]